MGWLDICRRYYETYGAGLIKQNFPEYENKIAVGVAGQGSEKFGFDDEISTDHDYGVGFCMWVDEDVYNEIGFKLTRAYQSLPEEFEGLEKYKIRPYGTDRFGVISIPEFFLPLTGFKGAPETLTAWVNTPEHFLATAVNGEIYRDDSGKFTQIRETIKNMPEDVRLKKISARLISMAQSGQYNFSRCLAHGEKGAAAIALSEFVSNAVRLCYTLEGRYSPFYKWMFRGMKNLEKYSRFEEPLTAIVTAPVDERLSEEIEKICSDFASCLREEGLSNSNGIFLEPHAYEVQKKIKTPEISGMHIMEG